MRDAYLLFGGNLGNVPQTFKKALQLMHKSGLYAEALSSLYETEAWGDGAKGLYYNQAVKIKTTLAPLHLLAILNSIEMRLGRKRIPGVIDPRPVDIDILLYDDIIVSLPELTIPHPRMHLRRFALTPLSELAPGVKHPLLKKTITQLLHTVADPLSVKKAGHSKTHPAAITE